MIYGLSTDICTAILILFIVIFILFIYLLARKKFIYAFNSQDINKIIQNSDYVFRENRWKTNLNHSKKKIRVTKDSLVAVDLYFKRNQKGNVQVLSASCTTELGLVLLIVLLLFAGIGLIIFALIIDYLSRKFANEALKTVLAKNSDLILSR